MATSGMDPMDEGTPGGSHDPPPPPPPSASQTTTGPSENNAAAAPATLAPPSAGTTPTLPAAFAQSGSKRKRGLGVVTPNACTECRKKRAKCDGQKPCGRCKSQKDVECIYEIPVRQSKDTLRHEIEQLRRQQHNNDQVLAALVRPDLWEEVLARLRNGQSAESISKWLGTTLSSGDGTLPPISRLFSPSGSGHSAVAGYGPGAHGAFASVAPGLNNSAESATGRQPHSIGQDEDQQSPWGGQFSSRSHSTPTGSHPGSMNWNPEVVRVPPQSRVGSWLESEVGSQRARGMDQVLAPHIPPMQVPAETWTTITSDPALVQHLLALYFCWEYPTFASLSKEHFLKDFMEGRARFCSSILVNALLALGCRFSSQPNTRANPNDPHTSGDHFFKESQRLFYQEENHHTLTTIQALGIMSIREASCGRDSESWYYAGQSIRLAIEMGLHRLQDDGKDDDESAVQAATFWGAFALDHAWSLATGSLPQSSCFPRLPPKPAIIDDIEASLWIPYTDDGAPLQRSCEQPSNVRSVYKCFCELSELVHQSLYMLHSPGKPLSSRDLLNVYTQYLNWYDRIPEVLRLGHNFTPAVLFAHMYYHFAILLLFRPLIKLRIIGSSISPRDVCSQAADAICGLLRSYSQLYTLRRTPSFVPYFVLTSSIMHLAIGATSSVQPQSTTGTDSAQHGQSAQASPRAPKLEPHAAEALSRGIEDLTEMAPCHHFAEQALNILRYLAKKWNVDIEIKPTPGDERPRSELPDIQQSTRPVTTSLNFFSPNFLESDFNCTWGEGSGPGLSDGDMRSINRPQGVPQIADALENPLFWPFPMQGRPMLPSGKELEEAGFEPIQ
ncbi:Nitrogen assimilation transcription factor nit-4 [Madurella mycetomatis]|uniref:Nitrogen assimilation transcription factor nit-4 n=1 Tax=Madurella mycetomatis TaxID=100816 RepID=A0A175VMZ2_9PEZI|nr:Nitrogen assimilation transcription factor nit-4 [Madurella mycetomatis]